MSNYFLGAVPFSDSRPPFWENVSEDQKANQAAPQTSVTFAYRAKVAGLESNITVTWCKNLSNHSLSITFGNPSDENLYTFKVDLRTWQFWGRKGLRSFELEGKQVGIFWDFRQAKFFCSPEPSSDYYIAMVSGEEMALLVGDLKAAAYKRTRSRPSLEDATLLCKTEHVYGKRLFCTRATLADGEKEYDIIIETSLSAPGDPEMWISIGSATMTRVTNLNWRFRGNETVMVNTSPVQILWDVHNWLHSNPGSGPGLFIFKPGMLECVSDSDSDGRNGSKRNGGGIINDPASGEGSTLTTEFCFFLYAWRTE